MHRRSFIQSALAGVVASNALSGSAAARKPKPFFAAHNLPIGLQLYTLDPDLDRDFDGTLAAISQVGYRSVELAGFHGRTARQLREAFDAHGLECRSAHIQGTAMGPGHSLSGDLEALAADAHVIGITDVVMPIFLFPAGFKPAAGMDMLGILRAAGKSLQASDYEHIAEFLTSTAHKLKTRALKVGYHNHNFELAPLASGATGLEVLLRHTDAALVSFELDVGWVAAAGLDPIELLQKHPGRFTQMHVKDIKPSTISNFALSQDPTEVGSGKIDWRSILPVAYQAGVRRYFVEQEPPYPGKRIDSVARSHQYLTTI